MSGQLLPTGAVGTRRGSRGTESTDGGKTLAGTITNDLVLVRVREDKTRREGESPDGVEWGLKNCLCK